MQFFFKRARQTLFRTITVSVETTKMGFHSGGERLDSTQNTAWTSRNLYQGVGMDGK